jgi:hypothetical protein
MRNRRRRSGSATKPRVPCNRRSPSTLLFRTIGALSDRAIKEADEVMRQSVGAISSRQAAKRP